MTWRQVEKWKVFEADVVKDVASMVGQTPLTLCARVGQWEVFANR
jgi:hypothetical protein